MKLKIKNIKWDKDEDDDTILPSGVEVELNAIFPKMYGDIIKWIGANIIDEVYPEFGDRIGDWLSDTYGYCHNGFEYEFVGYS